MKVQGKNVVIFIQQGTDWVLYACATSATLSVKTDLIETSVSGQGKFATFLPTKNSFTGTLEGVTSLEEAGKLSLPELRKKQLNQEILKLRYQRSDGTNLYTEEGSFYITSSDDVGSFDDMNIFTINAQGTGALSEVSSNTPAPVGFSFNYGSSEIDTVIVPGFTGAVFPTEDQFIQSVDTVFANGQELTGSEPNTGDNVKIVDFGSTGDKVRFLQMPESEPFFTRWSEENNPFQQNQPIDQSFDFLTGNVWFRSERNGMPLYMTYPQTSFTGAIIFSR
jgi:hypothetical protein